VTVGDYTSWTACNVKESISSAVYSYHGYKYETYMNMIMIGYIILHLHLHLQN